jgi:hypothetical protein
MAHTTFEETSKALRRAFFGTVDKALAETVKGLLGDAAPNESSTQEAWTEALCRIEGELHRKVEVRTGVSDRMTTCDHATLTSEVEVMRYEIWVDGKATREVVMTAETPLIEQPKFFIRSRLV